MDNFLDLVEDRIQAKSSNELKALIKKLASRIPDESRRDFLLTLENKQVMVSKSDKSGFDVKKALDRIKALSDSVEDYEIEAYYYESYQSKDGREGYQIESDDGFTDEFYACYDNAVSILEHGFYKEAADAFAMLFDIIEKFDEYNQNNDEGEFYFETFIDEGMLDIDLKKMGALKEYSALMSAPKDIGNVLEDIFDTLLTRHNGLMFSDILEAGNEPVPNRNAVLNSWTSVLYDQPAEMASAYMKEVSQLLGKTEIMEEYVNTAGSKEPRAYIDLCDLYSKQGKDGYGKIIAAASRGLQNIETAQKGRAELAGILSKAARESGNKGAYKNAVAERFFSSASVENYLAVLELGQPEMIQAALQNIDNSFGSAGSEAFRSVEYNYYLIHFLHADYDMIFNTIRKDKEPLGWSSSVKGLMAPFFMGLLTGFSEKSLMTQALMDEKLDRRIDRALFFKLLRENKGTVTEEQQKTWYEWCVKETEKRTDAIVSAQYRSSYDKAARLLTAVCEIQLYRKESAPYKLLNTYLAKYPRHTAFRTEVKNALAEAKLRIE